MSDYTPTTEETVCLYPANEAAHILLDGVWHHLNKWDFDRWLAEVKAQERERIIKLLEDTPATRTTWIDDGISVYALDKDDFIELIKGEEQ